LAALGAASEAKTEPATRAVIKKALIDFMGDIQK
jgi:hypothetical protein